MAAKRRPGSSGPSDQGEPTPGRGADRGVLVAFEGIDGSGKTTAAKRVHAALSDEGLDVHLTREPTDTPLGRRVREAIAGDDGPVHPVAQALLFMADHRRHVADIRARLAEGTHVLSDRWNDSCYAYQWATLEAARDDGRAAGIDDPLAWLERGMGDDDLRPDLVVLLDVDVETALSRLSGRGGRQTEGFERRELLQRVRDNYRALAERFGGYAVVDGTGDEEAVAKACLEVVGGALAAGFDGA